MTIGGGEYQSVSQSTWRRSGGSPMSCVEGVRACVQREGETGSKDGRRQRADAASLTFRFLPLLRPSCTSFYLQFLGQHGCGSPGRQQVGGER